MLFRTMAFLFGVIQRNGRIFFSVLFRFVAFQIRGKAAPPLSCTETTSNTPRNTKKRKKTTSVIDSNFGKYKYYEFQWIEYKFSWPGFLV